MSTIPFVVCLCHRPNDLPSFDILQNVIKTPSCYQLSLALNFFFQTEEKSHWALITNLQSFKMSLQYFYEILISKVHTVLRHRINSISTFKMKMQFRKLMHKDLQLLFENNQQNTAGILLQFWCCCRVDVKVSPHQIKCQALVILMATARPILGRNKIQITY